MIIYQVENLVNNKKYIGKTKGTLDGRKYGHFYDAKRGCKTIFHRAIRKYGEKNFKFSVLENCSDLNELNEKEKFYISELKSKTPCGYNMTDGGDGNDGTIKPNLGIPMKDEQKEKLRISNLGKKHSEETKRKMSESQIGKHSEPKGPSPKKGIPSGVEAWNKGMVGFLKGRTAWNKGLTKENNDVIARHSEIMKTKTVWNKGLTKEIDPRVLACSESLKNSESEGVFKKGRIPWNKIEIVQQIT